MEQLPTEPTIWTSAGAFFLAWIAAGFSLILLLAGRYGEMKDIATIREKTLRTPRKEWFYIASVLCFVAAAFWVFHLEQRTHWKERVALIERLNSKDETIADLRASREQAQRVAESVTTSRSGDMNLLRDTYEGRLADREDFQRQLQEVVEGRHAEDKATQARGIAQLRSRLASTDSVRWVSQILPEAKMDEAPVFGEEVYVFPASHTVTPAIVEMSCDCHILHSEIWLLGMRSGMLGWGERTVTQSRVAYELTSPPVNRAVLFRVRVFSKTPISNLRAVIREGSL